MAQPFEVLSRVLLDSSGEYLQNQRRLQAEDRARNYRTEERDRDRSERQEERALSRQERRGDITEERIYEEGIRQGVKRDTIEAEQRRIKQQMALQLIHENLLLPSQIDNDEAIQAAALKAQQAGLDKLYNDLLTTPGPNGTPLLRREELADGAKIEAAKQQLANIQAARVAQVEQAGQNAQAMQNEIAQDSAQARQRLSQIQTVLSAPPRPITQQELDTAAYEIASQGGTNPNPRPEEIAAARQQAKPALEQQRYIETEQTRREAQIQLQAENNRLQNNDRLIIQLGQGDLRRAPAASAWRTQSTPPATAPGSASQSSNVSPTDFIRSLSVPQSQPAPAPSVPAPNRAQAASNMRNLAPLQMAEDALGQTNRDISILQQSGAVRGRTPEQVGQLNTQLLQRRAQQQREFDRLRRQLGASPVVSPPSTSTFTDSAPLTNTRPMY